MSRRRMLTAGMLGALVATGLGAPARAESELARGIAVLDMERVMAAHPETKEAEGLLRSQADEMETEKDALFAKFEQLKDEFEAAREAADNRALSDEARKKKKEEAEDKLIALREFEQEARQTAMLRQKQLADRKRRMRDRILGRIREAVKAHALEHGYVLVLDSGAVLENPGAVLYNAEALDITEPIVEQIKKQTVDRAKLIEEANREDRPQERLKPPARRAGAEEAQSPEPEGAPGAENELLLKE